jgi:nitronate monooxygenase
VGLPGRALKSPFLQQVESGETQAFGCPWQCLASCNAQKAHYCISMALYHARKGNLKKGFAFAGANAYKIKNLVSVRELLFQLKHEFITCLESGILNLNREYENALTRFKAKKLEYRNKLQALKMEYRKKLKQKHHTMLEDYYWTIKKIESLKCDYLECFKQVREIAFQLDNAIKGNQAIPLPIRSQS